MQKIEDFIKASLFESVIEKLDIEINEEELKELISKFINYMNELKRWSKAYNLSSIDDDREIVVKHFIDSLLYLCFIPDESLTLADIGSGAGFPGIPISLIRKKLKVTLIEPSWKRCAFLKNIKKKLEIERLEILQQKAQNVIEKYDIVVSRALWSIREFLKNCHHLVKEGGFFIISKSAKLQEELKELPPQFKIEIKEFYLPKLFPAKEPSKRAIIKICGF